MKVSFEAKFSKDLLNINDGKLLEKVKQLVLACKAAKSINAISQLKKLKGYDTFYRVRIGDYRIGLELVGEDVIFTRCLHRKDIYRYFPR